MQLRSISCCHMFENMIYGKSLNVLTEYQTLLFLCIYQFAVVDLGEGPGTLTPLFWVESVGLGRHNFEHNAISGTVGIMLAEN